MGLLESIRKWVDGEGGSDPFAEGEGSAQPRRVWEEFFVRVAREIEAVMRREMFTPPGGQTYIPREYIVYLSNEDDREWQGDKRRGLEQGLFHVLSDRARQLSGTTKLATKTFAVELRVDGTLSKGEFRVQPVWDSSESNRTMVMPRPSAAAALNAEDGATATTSVNSESSSELNPEANLEIDDADAAGEMTQVRARPKEMYAVELWRSGVRQTIVPVTKPEITIGRGAKSMTVDLPIKGDPEVSRVHAILSVDASNRLWLSAQGRNPTLVGGREVPRGERVQVMPDDKIEICSFMLRVKLK